MPNSEEPQLSHWFEVLAEHMGSAYLRYSFTKGTRQEVDFLLDVLGLKPGSRILDVGCGPGRHAIELGKRGFNVCGVDISQRFIEIATANASELPNVEFIRADAREMRFSSEFDAVLCLCQGAFGMMTVNNDDALVLQGMARALKQDGSLAMSAFNSYFSVCHHDAADFDADAGVSHERTLVHNENGDTLEVSLWTGCYTPRELRLMLASVGLHCLAVYGAEPGKYSRKPPSVDDPEHLVIAKKS